MQESPAGRPSFSQIVKVLKDMATSLRPRKPRPPSSAAGASSRSSRLPSSSLPASSFRAVQPASESSTAVAEGAASAQPAPADPKHTQVAASPSQGKAAGGGESSPASDKMQNPFAAPSSQNRMAKDQESKVSSEPNRQAEQRTSINGNSVAAASGQDKATQSADPTQAGQQMGGIKPTLSLGTAIESISESSDRSTKPSPRDDKAAVGKEQGSRAEETPGPRTPTHQPPVSAFTALANKPKQHEDRL